MKAIVVYESHWGNTAAIARAIADGIADRIGPGAQTLSTAEASGAALADVDLIVAGAPVLGFSLPSDQMLQNLATGPSRGPTPPDLSHPSMRAWLAALPQGEGQGRAAAFETRLWWSLGGATAAIMRGLERAGYRSIAKAHRFIVKGAYGPLRAGELERARLWGAELAQAITG
jgi:hypothetical protein